MSLKETVIKLMCVVLMLVCFVQPVSADWYDDLKPNSTWVEIEGENFVADTFMGVKALYNENNRNHQCGDLVIRFYKEAFGLDIYPYGSGGPSSETGGYKFVRTSSPKPGDIIYVSKEMRGSDQDHWAIVRDYSDGYITMFEQNVVWNGQAVVGRKIKYPSNSYYVYTLVRTDGSTPNLGGSKPDVTQVTTTKAPETTVAPVTETTTAVPATVTTTKPATTVATTKAQITAAQTTQAATEMTTVNLTEDVTEEYTVPLSGVDSAYSELNTTKAQTIKETTTAKSGEEENGRTNPVILAVGVCAALIAVAAVVMVIAKKKRK